MGPGTQGNEMHFPLETKGPIRVLHIIGNLRKGGVESVVFNYFRAADKSRVMFDFAVDESSPCGVPDDITALGGKVYKIPPITELKSYVSALKKICKSEKYKIVHSHMNTLSVFPLFAAWRAGVPVRIAHSHSTAGLGQDFKRDLLKYILRPFSKVFPTHYFACSAYAGQWLFGKGALRKGKVAIFKNAIATKRFRYDPAMRERVREGSGISDRFVIGHIGRFSPQKNHRFLLDIFDAVCRRRDDAVLCLLGGLGLPEEKLEWEIRAEAARRGLSERVQFLGIREDVSGFYQAFDVFVLPSLYEGLPLVAIEAQASGLPCVLSDRVTKEAKILQNVCFVPIRSGADAWADVLCEEHGEARGDHTGELAEAGYEITLAVEQLTLQYEALANWDRTAAYGTTK